MSDKLKQLKKSIKGGKYDWKKVIEDIATKIVDYPQALLWR